MEKRCKVCKNVHVDRYGLCAVCGQKVKRQNSKILIVFLVVLALSLLVQWFYGGNLFYFISIPFLFFIVGLLVRLPNMKERAKLQAEKLVYPSYYLHSDTLKAIEAIRLAEKPEQLVEAALFWENKRESNDMLLICLGRVLEVKRSFQKKYVHLKKQENAYKYKRFEKVIEFIKSNEENLQLSKSDLSFLSESNEFVEKEKSDFSLGIEKSDDFVSHKDEEVAGRVDYWAIEKLQQGPKICGDCDKKLSQKYEVGMDCPSCGARWIEEKDGYLIGGQAKASNLKQHWSKYPNLIPLLIDLPISEVQLSNSGGMGKLIELLEQDANNNLAEIEFEVGEGKLESKKELTNFHVVIVRNEPNLYSWKH